MKERRRKRVTYRPSKSNAAFGGVFGIIFVLIGLFVVIPTFGAFGVLWTLVAAVGTGMNFYQAYGKKYMGPEIHIEDEGESEATPPSASDSVGLDASKRLEQLKNLKDSGLITKEEYDAKREEIIRTL